MDRLNYFNPYQTKEGYHEDQLTRSYLVLLKHSFHAFSMFYEYVKDQHKIIEGTEQKYSLYNLLDEGWEIKTQKGNPIIETNWILSVLITDEQLPAPSKSLSKSDRNARYDGIITFGSKLTLIIEVKPRSGNVWEGQLSPAKGNLSEDTVLYSKPAILEWKAIIKQLNNLLSLPTISGYEKAMIEDFLAYIDEQFPYLNPYDRFDLCKGNTELLKRRIKNVLESIVTDKSLVKYHNGWGYYIETPFSEIRQIGLILGKNEENKKFIELSLYYGANQNQAKNFYRHQPGINKDEFREWYVYGNFHVSFMTTNLIWFDCCPTERYIEYWKNNIHLIHQYSRKDVPAFLQKLVDDDVIKISASKESELENKFYKSKYKTLNMVPEIGFLYNIPLADAERIDKNGDLERLLIEKIKVGLGVIGRDGTEFLK